MGFEGLKILESHPSLELELDFRMNDMRFDAMFQYAEENEIPVLMHVADPEESWDINTVDQYALTHGRFYGAEGRRPKEEYYREVEDILERHPKLRVIFAHFYFMSADIDRAEALFEKYPNIAFDLTPGKEMYENFGKNLEKTKAFFERFADRLYYGTDVNDTSAFNYHSSLYTLVSTALESGEPFQWGKYNCAGLGLSEEAKKKIKSKNFIKLLGETPKPLNYEAIRTEIARLYSVIDNLNDKDKEYLLVAKEYFADK
jgi:predicted TIM-barrel fold metal-dependent hydrolase